MLVVYVIMIVGSVYGCLQVEIDFKVSYFIGESSDVYEYFQLNNKYFNSGTITTTYVQNAQIDYSSTETQRAMLSFNKNYEECTGCDEQWNM